VYGGSSPPPSGGTVSTYADVCHIGDAKNKEVGGGGDGVNILVCGRHSRGSARLEHVAGGVIRSCRCPLLPALHKSIPLSSNFFLCMSQILLFEDKKNSISSAHP
jgi:hypothetical protein